MIEKLKARLEELLQQEQAAFAQLNSIAGARAEVQRLIAETEEGSAGDALVLPKPTRENSTMPCKAGEA